MGLPALAGVTMKRFLLAGLLLFALATAQAAEHHLLIVTGIGGTDQYRAQFEATAKRLQASAREAGLAEDNIISLGETEDGNNASRASVLAALSAIAERTAPGDRVFIVLIGHGNPRGTSAVFNLPGPDLSATELADALQVFTEQQVVIVNTASASGPFVIPLSGENRVIITATASGREFHATLFGDYFVDALAEPGADTDKDARVSMLEAFEYARHEVRRAFDSDKKLLTEHAMLDDNGDGSGSREPDPFRGDGALAQRIHLQQPPLQALGASAELVAMSERKQALEDAIDVLRRERESYTHEDYYSRLEALLVELALLARDMRAEGES